MIGVELGRRRSDASVFASTNNAFLDQTPFLCTAQTSGMSFAHTPDYNHFVGSAPGTNDFAAPIYHAFLPDDAFMVDWEQIGFDLHFDFDYDLKPQTPQDTSTYTLNPRATMLHDAFPADSYGMMLDSAPFNVTALQTDPLEESSGAASHLPMARASEHLQGSGLVITDASAAVYDAWPMFKCNPCVTSANCPRTGRLNLETLERMLESEEVWESYPEPLVEDLDTLGLHNIDVGLIHEVDRDRLLAIMQSVLHKTLDTHQDDRDTRSESSSGFILLPPTRVLEMFLRTYTRSFEQYYAVTPRGCLNSNDILQHGDNR